MKAHRPPSPFEYRTIRQGDTIVCICIYDGEHTSVTIRCGPRTDPASVSNRMVERLAGKAHLLDLRRRLEGRANRQRRLPPV